MGDAEKVVDTEDIPKFKKKPLHKRLVISTLAYSIWASVFRSKVEVFEMMCLLNLCGIRRNYERRKFTNRGRFSIVKRLKRNALKWSMYGENGRKGSLKVCIVRTLMVKWKEENQRRNGGSRRKSS